MESFFFDTQEYILILCKREFPQDPERPSEVFAQTNIDQINLLNGEALVYFKKKDIILESVTSEKNYLKTVFNILSMGEINEQFNVLETFHETLRNGILPLFNDFKNHNTQKNDLSIIYTKQEKEQFNEIYKKVNALEQQIQQKLSSSSISHIEFDFDQRIKDISASIPEGEEADIDKVPSELREDNEFLQDLVESRTKWYNQAQALIKYGQDKKVISLVDEINFWHNFVDSLDHLQKILQKNEVKITQAILKHR